VSAAQARSIATVRELRIPVPGEEIVLRARAAGSGPAVLLLHAFGEDLDVWWSRDWVPALLRHRRVIAFDARGHGASTKPRDPSQYSAHARVIDALAVLDVLDSRAVDVVGYAMGAWTALQLASRVPGRVRSIVAGGVPATGQQLSTLRRTLSGGMSAVVEMVEKQTGPLPEPTRERYLANDVEALAAVCAEDRHTMIEELAAFDGPAMFYVGERDTLRPAVESSAQHLGWPCRVIAGRDHFDLSLTGAALPTVLDFLAG